MLLVQLLRRRQIRDVDADQHRLQPPAQARRPRGRGGPGLLADIGRSRAKKLSSTSSPGGGKTRTCRRNSCAPGRAARRIVAVEAITFGRTVDAVELPGREPVDRGLVEADHRPERARDQVQLVLDDEVGRPQQHPRSTVFAAGSEPFAGWLSVSSSSGERNPCRSHLPSTWPNSVCVAPFQASERTCRPSR